LHSWTLSFERRVLIDQEYFFEQSWKFFINQVFRAKKSSVFICVELTKALGKTERVSSQVIDQKDVKYHEISKFRIFDRIFFEIQKVEKNFRTKINSKPIKHDRNSLFAQI
jgi:hypothetical protein